MKRIYLYIIWVIIIQFTLCDYLHASDTNVCWTTGGNNNVLESCSNLYKEESSIDLSIDDQEITFSWNDENEGDSLNKKLGNRVDQTMTS